MDGLKKEWLRLTALLTGNQSGTRCDACRKTGAIHCADAFDGCIGMRPYTVEEIVEVVKHKDSATALEEKPKRPEGV